MNWVSNPYPTVWYTVHCTFVIDLGYQGSPLIVERNKGIRIGKGKSRSRVGKHKILEWRGLPGQSWLLRPETWWQNDLMESKVSAELTHALWGPWVFTHGTWESGGQDASPRDWNMYPIAHFLSLFLAFPGISKGLLPGRYGTRIPQNKGIPHARESPKYLFPCNLNAVICVL